MRRPWHRPRIPFARTIPWSWLAVWLALALLEAAALDAPLARVALAWVCYWAAWLLLLYLLSRWWRAGWLTYYRTVRWWRRARRGHGSARG